MALFHRSRCQIKKGTDMFEIADNSIPPVLSKTPDAARFLRCSEPTVRELIRTKRLHAIKVGRGYRIPREALVAFLGAGDTPRQP